MAIKAAHDSNSNFNWPVIQISYDTPFFTLADTGAFQRQQSQGVSTMVLL
jgi:hypothetical protein